MRRWILALAAALSVLAPARSSAHDIPASLVIQAFVRPQGDRLRLIVRVPLGAMRDVEFPLRAVAAVLAPAIAWLIAVIYPASRFALRPAGRPAEQPHGDTPGKGNEELT